jgi:ribosomal protein S18 acetylase RimI-like enzyme
MSHSLVVISHENVSQFYFRTKEFCAQDPIQNNVISTIAISSSQQENITGKDKCFWWTIHESNEKEMEGEIVGVVIHTPGRPMLFSPMPISASEVFAHYLAEHNDHQVTAVHGPQEVVLAFLNKFSPLTNADATSHPGYILKVTHVIYELKEFHEPTRVRSGSPRQLSQSDLELGVIFLREFSEEVLLETHDLHELVQAKINSGLFWFWIDLVDGRETVVALGGHSHLVVDPSVGTSSDKETLTTDPFLLDPTSNKEKTFTDETGKRGTGGVARIGPIYTRSDYRCRGYGTSLTAFLTSKLLHEWNCRVMLFADKFNPASNSVYRQLGFEIVGENLEYSLTEP